MAGAVPRDDIALYDGAIHAHRVASFLMGGRAFDVIRPGYDAQGRRRIQWTQFIHEGVPVFEVRTRVTLERAIARFDEHWAATFEGADPGLVDEALAGVKAERRKAFRDGQAGVEPALSASRDGRGGQGVSYTA